MRSKELALKRGAPDLIGYAFVGVSLSNVKFMGREYGKNDSRNAIY